MKSVLPSDAKIYYQGEYWNDIPEVIEYMNRAFNPKRPVHWVEDFRQRYAAKPFKRALFICCGNGWLDREFIDKKMVIEADAFDYSTELLDQAKKEKGKRKIKYFQADANTLSLKKNYYDLVVNHAGLHHVQYINRFMKMLAQSMTPDGVMVNLDYIGPSRNQYGTEQWRIAKTENNKLPISIRMETLLYPHLPTMLRNDPTEAIHSDLIFPMLERYFLLKERNDVNGGLAYLLLTRNPKIKLLKPAIRKQLVNQILERDKALTESKKIPPLFSYFIAVPNKEASKDSGVNQHFQEEENKRESLAESRLGCYTLWEYIRVKFNPLIHRLATRFKMIKRIIGFSTE